MGRAPLNQKESRALAGYTAYIDPDLILAYHAQGKEIYWQFDDITVAGAQELGERFAALSGYLLTNPAPNSSYAGYSDFSLVVLNLTMLLGRLEILPVLILFNRRTWQKI